MGYWEMRDDAERNLRLDMLAEVEAALKDWIIGAREELVLLGNTSDINLLPGVALGADGNIQFIVKAVNSATGKEGSSGLCKTFAEARLKALSAIASRGVHSHMDDRGI